MPEGLITGRILVFRHDGSSRWAFHIIIKYGKDSILNAPLKTYTTEEKAEKAAQRWCKLLGVKVEDVFKRQDKAWFEEMAGASTFAGLSPIEAE